MIEAYRDLHDDREPLTILIVALLVAGYLALSKRLGTSSAWKAGAPDLRIGLFAGNPVRLNLVTAS